MINCKYTTASKQFLNPIVKPQKHVTQIYMTTHFPGLVQHFYKKNGGDKLVL